VREGINPVAKLYIAETGNVQASHRLISPPRHLRHRSHKTLARSVTFIYYHESTC